MLTATPAAVVPVWSPLGRSFPTPSPVLRPVWKEGPAPPALGERRGELSVNCPPLSGILQGRRFICPLSQSVSHHLSKRNARVFISHSRLQCNSTLFYCSGGPGSTVGHSCGSRVPVTWLQPGGLVPFGFGHSLTSVTQDSPGASCIFTAPVPESLLSQSF